MLEAMMQKVFKNKLFVTIILIAIALVGLFGGFYYFAIYQKSPTQAAKLETQTLVAKVGKHIMLPGDEEPNVATVSDVNKLKDQAFFKNAKNGYKVLIY